jgi:hypothetical protein
MYVSVKRSKPMWIVTKNINEKEKKVIHGDSPNEKAQLWSNGIS